MNTNFYSRCLQGSQAALVLIACATAVPHVSAEEATEDTYMGESPDRYAQVKAVEGDVRIRKGDEEEPLGRNIPVAEGDVVESRGRGVLQLGDGSRLAFAENTRVQVVALFMNRSGEREVVLRLDRGRIRVQVGADSKAEIRVDTPSGTGRIGDRGMAELEVAEDHTVRVKVSTGHLDFANESDRTTINGGERLTVYSNHDQLDRIRSFNTFDNDSFDAWSDRYFNVRRGESSTRVPSEIRHYADDLDGHGEWDYVSEYSSWCWRPTGISEDWRPYYDGRWAAYPGGMTWIDAAPWGFVTSHYGRWGWRTGFGWCWIPGVYYSPAWVAWHSMDGYIGWAPMGFYNAPCTWGYGGWGGGYCWNVVNVNHINVNRVNTYISRDTSVIRRFNPVLARPVPGAWPNRPLAPAWRQGPVIVRRDEFRNPVQVHNIIQDRSAADHRLREYEQQGRNRTGREVYLRQNPLSRPGSPIPVAQPGQFEDRSRLRQNIGQPGQRPLPDRRSDSAPRPQDRPGMEVGRPQPRPEMRQETPRTQTPPASQTQPPSNPRFDSRRDYSRQDRPRQDSPRQQEPRNEAPRERPRVEERQAPARDYPRPDVRRESPRQEMRESPARSEPSRSAPPTRSEPSHSAPQQRQEAPRSEPSRSQPSQNTNPHPAQERRR